MFTEQTDELDLTIRRRMTETPRHQSEHPLGTHPRNQRAEPTSRSERSISSPMACASRMLHRLVRVAGFNRARYAWSASAIGLIPSYQYRFLRRHRRRRASGCTSQAGPLSAAQLSLATRRRSCPTAAAAQRSRLAAQVTSRRGTRQHRRVSTPAARRCTRASGTTRGSGESPRAAR
jgi:hypothetical protein